MPNPEKISSAQNPKIKNLKKLEKASGRREQNLMLIEGMREISLAKQAGYVISALYICEDILKKENVPALLFQTDSHQSPPLFYSVSREIYDALAYRESTEGLIATAYPKELTLAHLQLKESPLLLVIESVEKPGNLGAMLRTCDAAGVDAVIICDAKTEVYNPNVIRSSIGTVFTNKIAICETNEAIAFLKNNRILIFTAEPEAHQYHFNQNFKQASAIVVGTEATGLSETWTQAANERIKIPMLGKIDSLNVSVSAAVLLFEALRQRN